MIVCTCRSIDDVAIAEAIDAGARTTYDVGRITGACRRCGSCAPAIVSLIAQVSSGVRPKGEPRP